MFGSITSAMHRELVFPPVLFSYLLRLEGLVSFLFSPDANKIFCLQYIPPTPIRKLRGVSGGGGHIRITLSVCPEFVWTMSPAPLNHF